MMSELKMSEIFDLPMLAVSGEMLCGDDGRWWASFNDYDEAVALAVAVNAYDSHVEQIAKLTKDVEILRTALMLVDTHDEYHTQPWFDCGYSKVVDFALYETEPSN